ncbi:Uncharacterized protein ALO61_04997 [Pseudomonas savastanoi pv. nerii]|nr:Uncharacterized protein ALO61_04997 [Pseudomonas savastanoi pv. nerii]
MAWRTAGRRVALPVRSCSTRRRRAVARSAFRPQTACAQACSAVAPPGASKPRALSWPSRSSWSIKSACIMASVPLIGLFSDSGRAGCQGQVLCVAHGRIDYRYVVFSSGRAYSICRFSIVLSTMTFAISTRCMIVSVISLCAPVMLSLNS